MWGVRKFGGVINVRNSILWNNTQGGSDGGGVTYSCTQDGTVGLGNTNTNPQFVDTTYYHLKSRAGQYTNGYFAGGGWGLGTTNSPLIDKAYTFSSYGIEPHPHGFRANMGAYGNSSVASKTFLEEPGTYTGLAVYAYAPTNAGLTNATLWGQVMHTGGGPNPKVYVCWGTSDGGLTTGTWDQVVYMGTSWGQWGVFRTNITTLALGATYRVRAYVTNSTGQDWSSVLVTFRTTVPATITNLGPYRVRRSSSTLQGRVADTGGDTPSIWFHHWRVGSVSTSIVAMGKLDGTAPFTTSLSGLWTNTQYQYRILSSNMAGKAWSVTRSYATLSTNPISRYVIVSGAGIQDGTNWANAYGSMEDALLDCTYRGDTIYMKDDSYERDFALTISNYPNLRIVGGMAGTAPEPGPAAAQPTRFVRDPTFVTRLLYIVKSTVTLDRITFAGGYLTADGADGAGIYAFNNTALTLTNCTFRTNVLYTAGVQEGAALYHSGGRLTVLNSLFYTNKCLKPSWATSCHGAGIAAINAQLTVRDSRFHGNYMWCRHYDLFGAAVYASGGTATVEGCVFTNNYVYGEGESGPSANAFGGAIHFASVKRARIADSFFSRNRVMDFGAAMGRGAACYFAGTTGVICRAIFRKDGDVDNGRGVLFLASGRLWATNVLVAQATAENGVLALAGNVTLVNVTMADNGTRGLSNTAATVTMRNGIVWGNTAGGIGGNATVSYSCIQGGFTGTGNISADPLFLDTKHYHPKSTVGVYTNGYFSGGTWTVASLMSPTVDAGDPSDLFQMEAPPSGPRINMGYDGNTGTASKGVLKGAIFCFL